MQKPAPALLQEYLDGMDSLDELQNQRRQFFENWDWREDVDPEWTQWLVALDSKIERVEVWISRTAACLDELFHATADWAEAGRAVFLSVAQRIQELRELPEAAWVKLSKQDRLEWSLIEADYAMLRSAWVLKLPLEDRKRVSE